MVPVRVVSGIWLLVLTAILYGYGRGGWWGALLVPSAVLHFYLACRLSRTFRAGAPHAPWATGGS